MSAVNMKRLRLSLMSNKNDMEYLNVKSVMF